MTGQIALTGYLELTGLRKQSVLAALRQVKGQVRARLGGGGGGGFEPDCRQSGGQKFNAAQFGLW